MVIQRITHFTKKLFRLQEDTMRVLSLHGWRGSSKCTFRNQTKMAERISFEQANQAPKPLFRADLAKFKMMKKTPAAPASQ